MQLLMLYCCTTEYYSTLHYYNCDSCFEELEIPQLHLQLQLQLLYNYTYNCKLAGVVSQSTQTSFSFSEIPARKRSKLTYSVVEKGIMKADQKAARVNRQIVKNE